MSTPSLLSSNWRACYVGYAFSAAFFSAFYLNDARKAYKAITQINERSVENNGDLARTILKVAENLLQIIGALSAAVLCIPVAFWCGKMAVEGLYYKEVDHLIAWIGSPLIFTAGMINMTGTWMCDAPEKTNRRSP